MTRARWLDAAKLLFGLFVLALLANSARQHWAEIGPLLQSLDLRLMGLALTAQLAAFALLPIASQSAIRIWKPNYSYLSAARLFFQSQLAKYLPGSVWVFPARVFLLQKAGLSLPAGSYVLLLETAALCASSLLIGVVGFANFPTKLIAWRPGLIVVALIGIVALLILRNRPAWLFRVLPAKWRPAKKTQEPIRISAFASLLALTSLAASWTLSGLTFYFVLRSLGSNLGPADIGPIVSAFSLAWLLGFLVVISPGGIGVREAVLIFLLGATLGATQISVAAVVARLLWSACELMLYFLFTQSRLGEFHVE